MSAPILYDFALDLRCYSVRLGASLMGRTVTIRDVDVLPGAEHLSPDMLALNPKGTVPVFADGDVTLSEPAAILAHLAKGQVWAAESPQALDWLVFAASMLDSFNTARHAALFYQPSTPEYDGIATGTVQTKTRLRQLDDWLGLAGLRDQSFLAGNEPSIADVLAFAVFAQSRDLRIEPEAYPALRLWARKIRSMTGFIGMPGVPDYH